MPDDRADPCPPDAENETPEAPAPRAAPLRNTDKSDVGCLIFLFATFCGVFLIIPAIWFGGPLVIAAVAALMFALVTPLINPAERSSRAARWTGRVIVFLILSAILAGVWYWLFRNFSHDPVEVIQSSGS